MSERLLTAEQVAERLLVPESWVRRETRAGRMPCLELGRYRRYEWEAVVDWLVGQRAGQWRRYTPCQDLLS
jgi:excisionase family DNA binding protein